MRRIAFWVMGFLVGCGGGSGPDNLAIVCGAGGEAGVLTPGSAVVLEGGAHGGALDLRGAGLAAPPGSTPPAAPITLRCVDDGLPAGTKALGPAVEIGPLGSTSAKPFRVTLPYKAARLPAGATRRHVRIVERRGGGDGTAYFAPVANLTIDDGDPLASRVSFDAQELATYQVVALADAGQPRSRRYTYTAIAGVSMGGASIGIGLRRSERFDLIGVLGGEPGPSTVYSLAMVRDYLFGGFCEGTGGGVCPGAQRPTLDDQHEIGSDFEHFVYQAGDGVGLTLRRNLYIRAARDLSRALGNPALYNPKSPYLPPGVPESFLDAPDRCANPVVLMGFHDRAFNPTGALPVITFCDGGDSTELGLGVYDASLAQENPVDVLLAVDLDGNGRRDAGEPIVVQAYERFEDVGSDGVPSREEPGYDAAGNPDPGGDDYHAIRNPLGTEGNWIREESEPYEDLGLDGVEGTCQLPAPDCFDWGEGDGEWTVNPNVLRWFANDAGLNLTAMSAAERDRISLYFDAGIRDFFNGHVAANAAMGRVFTLGIPAGIYDGFHALDGSTSDALYDFLKVPWPVLPENVYVRYGDPAASETQIMNGDGRHVGTPLQIVNRVTTLFAWINARWPDGDRAIAPASQDDLLRDQHFVSPTTGRDTPYALFLPPGYDENPTLRYPVVYFLHGYGQQPDDLIAISGVFANYMIDPQLPEEQRFQKMMIVYVDGRCRDGDGCEQGTFYMDSPVNETAAMETHLFELMDEIDSTYRTKGAETREVMP